MLCMGDLNISHIEWPSLSLTNHDSQVNREAMHFSLISSLKQIVHDATRGTVILDLIFLSPRVCDCGYECTVVDWISDHKAVFASISCPVPKSRYVYTTFHDINHADDVSIIGIHSALPPASLN